jgi:hypothetical protein
MKLSEDKKTVILEKKPCVWCDGTGLSAKQVPCYTCKGTGRGPRGGKGGCRKCSGFGHVYSPTEKETCTGCMGEKMVPENDCDSMPDEWWHNMTFKVYRQDRDQTYNEFLLAHNCVFSCSDYGKAAGASDESIIESVRKETYVQLCKVARDLKFCDHVGIFVNRGGYSVRAVFGSDASETLKTIASERGIDEGMAVGNAIAAAGGNGTMGAIYK